MSLFILIYYSFNQKNFVPFSNNFDFFYSFFLLTFFLLYLLFLFVYKHILVSKNKEITFQKKSLVLYTWNTYYIICTLFALYSIILFFYFFISAKSFGSLRILLSQGGSFHVGMSYPLCCSMLFYMREKNVIKGRKFIIVLIIALAIISTSKQFLLLTFLFLVPWYRRNFKVDIKLILMIIIIGLGVFMMMHIFVGHIHLTNMNTLLSIVLKQFNSYFIGPLASFQLHLDERWEAAILDIPGWVKAGDYIGNVHTAFFTYYNKRSFFILFINIFFISLIYSSIHSKNTLFFNFMKVYAVFPLYMLFFADLMFKSMWISFALAGLGISFIGNSKTNEKYLFTHNSL